MTMDDHDDDDDTMQENCANSVIIVPPTSTSQSVAVTRLLLDEALAISNVISRIKPWECGDISICCEVVLVREDERSDTRKMAHCGRLDANADCHVAARLLPMSCSSVAEFQFHVNELRKGNPYTRTLVQDESHVQDTYEFLRGILNLHNEAPFFFRISNGLKALAEYALENITGEEEEEDEEDACMTPKRMDDEENDEGDNVVIVGGPVENKKDDIGNSSSSSEGEDENRDLAGDAFGMQYGATRDGDVDDDFSSGGAKGTDVQGGKKKKGFKRLRRAASSDSSGTENGSGSEF